MLYTFPLYTNTSFSLVARTQFEHMKKKDPEVYAIDEIAFARFIPDKKTDVIVHPSIFVMNRILQTRVDYYGRFKPEYYAWWRKLYDQLIGFDVCDSDTMSDVAVGLLNLLDKVAVPSQYCVKVYANSGVKTKTYWVPHGVEHYWYETPNLWENVKLESIHPSLLELYSYKKRKNKKLLLFWLMHSPDRKGWDEAKEIYKRIRKQRSDVILVLKTEKPNTEWYQEIEDWGVVNIYGWLDETQKMMLYDIADVNLVTSRGGGFEMNALEAIARGTPTIATNYGSWTDYMPEKLLVPPGEKVKPLPNNHLHVGWGYKIDVVSAVDKINEILQNYEEYKLIVEDHRQKIKETFNWDNVTDLAFKMIKDKS